VPASTRIWIGNYDFDLADVNAPHTIAEVSMAQEGPIAYTMQDWSGGLQSVEEGIEYRRLPKYISATGVDAAFPGQVICQPGVVAVSVGSGPVLGQAIRQVDFTPSGGTISSFLIENNRYQHKISVANPVWTQSVDLGSGQLGTDGIAHGGKIAIGYGSGGQVYSADGVSFTVATANKADAYGALGANLYRGVKPNTVYAATAVDGTWDSGSSIGDSSFPINSITGLEQVLMIGKQDGIHSIDADGTVVPFTPELRSQSNLLMALIRGTATFNNDFYFKTVNGIIKISGASGTKERVGFDRLASPDLTAIGVTGLAADDRYLYALTANGSTAGPMILRRTVSGVWHPFYWDGTAGIKQGQHIAVSQALGGTALFYSTYNGFTTWTTKYIPLSSYPNPLQDTTYSYDTTQTGRFRVPRFGSAEYQMVLDQMTIQTRQCSANLTIIPYYSADGGAITQFGAAAVTSNPFTTIRPAAAITCNFIDLYFDLATNTASTTPVLTGFSLKGLRRPHHRRVHTFTLNTARGHRDVRGGQRREAPTEAAADLSLLLATNAYATVKDERGGTFSGLVSAVNRTTIKPKASAEPEEAVQVVINEAVSVAGVSAPFTYGSAVYN
jgi:hypothetical protein